MVWFILGLFVLGAACGAAIRMMVFLFVLLGATSIAVAASVEHGLGATLLNAVITVVALQIGYAAGLILRTAVYSRREQSLTVYNTESHTLYVYPRVTEGNSHISCEYSFRVSVPGAPMERQNCPVGSLTQ